MNPSQQDLLGYLLGALDAQEQRDLQQQIDNDPSLEESLLDLKAALVPLDCLDNSGYRPGLARRACEAVASWDAESAASQLAFLDHTEIDWEEGCEQPSSTEPTQAPTQTPAPADAVEPSFGESKTNPEPMVQTSSAPELAVPAGASLASPQSNSLADGRQFNGSSWSMRDVLVGVTALAVLAGLLFPALQYSRQQGQLMACQNNLRQVGMAFMNYSSIHEGEFVSIPDHGNLAASGCYGPILKDAGLLADDSLLACAGMGSDAAPVVIPSVEQIEAAETESERSFYRKTMGGNYGYSMGYRDGDRYRSPRAGAADSILLADQPSSRSDRQSLNHDGNGQNCLFSDGRVTFVSGPAFGDDLVYENDRGIVAPGTNESDNVIAPSHLAPIF